MHNNVLFIQRVMLSASLYDGFWLAINVFVIPISCLCVINIIAVVWILAIFKTIFIVIVIVLGVNVPLGS